jgi:hypothetical protein
MKIEYRYKFAPTHTKGLADDPFKWVLVDSFVLSSDYFKFYDFRVNGIVHTDFDSDVQKIVSWMILSGLVD